MDEVGWLMRHGTAGFGYMTGAKGPFFLSRKGRKMVTELPGMTCKIKRLS